MVYLPAALSIFLNKHQICRHLQTLGPLVYFFKQPSSVYSPKQDYLKMPKLSPINLPSD